MTYAQQRYLSIALTVILAGLAIIQAARPEDYGLSAVTARWLAVIVAMLGVAQGFLPSVRGMSRNPDFLANRVSELPERDRAQVIGEVQTRAGDVPAPPPLAPTAEEIAAAYDRLRRIRAAERLREMGRS